MALIPTASRHALCFNADRSLPASQAASEAAKASNVGISNDTEDPHGSFPPRYPPPCRVARLVCRCCLVAILLRFGATRSTAFKTAEVSVFGGYLYWKPDYGPARDNGIAVGANYTRYFHFPVAPSLEARANATNGPYANEKSYLGGVRGLYVTNSRFHPYVDFLFGRGTIHYSESARPFGVIIGDNSAIYNYGGGVDIDVARNFSAKVDVQAQRWRPGVNTFYHPVGLLIGVTYHIPFRPYVSQRDLH